MSYQLHSSSIMSSLHSVNVPEEIIVKLMMLRRFLLKRGACRWAVLALTITVLMTPSLSAKTAQEVSAAAKLPSSTAEAPAALEQIRILNQQALRAFEGYSFKKAEQQLEQALLDAQKKAHLGGTAELAESYMLLGIAHVAAHNDLYRGLQYFVQALRIHSAMEIPPSLDTPQLRQIFELARQTISAVGNPQTIPLENKATALAPKEHQGGQGLMHSPLQGAKRGYPLPIKVSVGHDSGAQRMLLFYRRPGTTAFYEIPMTASREVFRAAIPASAMKGKYLHYYIEASDGRGRFIGSQGSAQSPIVVTINE
jgi:hypothetical protein